MRRIKKPTALAYYQGNAAAKLKKDRLDHLFGIDDALIGAGISALGGIFGGGSSGPPSNEKIDSFLQSQQMNGTSVSYNGPTEGAQPVQSKKTNWAVIAIIAVVAITIAGGSIFLLTRK